MYKKKLIEVALPLEAINKASAREKSIRHGHPSTLHLWWARRPLASARAVIWSSLVDDPSEHPELFPTEVEQQKERQRLFAILEKLVEWENANNQEVLQEAKAEILKYTENNPPALLDPFAGGGSIPLEAQRLGLEAHAHDLNPVAVLINKAMIEIPPRFCGLAPVNPQNRGEGLLPGEKGCCLGRRAAANSRSTFYAGAKGLAQDVRYYGQWLKNEAFKRIGQLYPKVKLPAQYGGGEATVIAWIWARTVKCPNPTCGCQMPLVKTFILSKKQDREAWVEPIVDGTAISYQVRQGPCPLEGTVNRKGARCICCGANVPFEYIRQEGQAGRLGSTLIAVVAEGKNGRLYLSADEEQVKAAEVDRPEDVPNTDLPEKALGFRVQTYGIRKHYQLFTNRQLTALTTFSQLVKEAQQQAEIDALEAGWEDDKVPLNKDGAGALAYSQAISIYLAFLIDKLADYHSSICSWHTSGEKVRNTFGRQAIPMAWDYAEGNPFSNSSGCFDNMLEWITKCLLALPAEAFGEAKQWNAQSDCGLRQIMISTDPPYYDNIGYADLSDYFYIWLRQSLRSVYPEIFRTMLVPKAEELIATPYRHENNKAKAKEFFEDGMLQACRQLYQYASDKLPVTIYYAYKQSETKEQAGQKVTSSSGWETMLSAIIKAGFAITGTWPISTEMANRSVASEANALASSIVLVCRKRPASASTISRRRFVTELSCELQPALKKLQSSQIAPVDLAQAAIGPGMAVYSKYSAVLEANGTPVSVRSALQLINQELDACLNEQSGQLDSASRFCVDIYSQYAFKELPFGEAEVLAKAKNISLDSLIKGNVIKAEKGKVCLVDRSEMELKVSSNDCGWTICQKLAKALQEGGIVQCAQIVATNTKATNAKELAYRLYTIAERQGWNQDALAYNSLIMSWSQISAKADSLKKQAKADQGTMF